MKSFKSFLNENRWIAASDLEPRVYKAIKDSVINMPDLSAVVKVDKENRLGIDQDKLEAAFDSLFHDLSRKLTKIAQEEFSARYPIKPKNLKVRAIADYRVNALGMAGPHGPNNDTIMVELNIKDDVETMVKAKATMDDQPTRAYEIKKFILLKIVDKWTKTVVHEFIHVGQALGIRSENEQLYRKAFMPKFYTDPKLRKVAEAGMADGSYLMQVQEIQTHSVSGTLSLLRRMKVENVKKLLDDYEKWLMSANPRPYTTDKRDPLTKLLDNMTGSRSGINVTDKDHRRIVMSAPDGVARDMLDTQEFGAYAMAYLVGTIDRKAITRFIREAKRTVKEYESRR